MAVAVLIGGSLVLVSRGINRPPVISRFEAHPGAVPRAGSAQLTVTATDPDGDALRFDYKADTGTIEPGPNAGEARYSPAAQGGLLDRITVTVTDARLMATTAVIGVTIQAPAVASTPTPEPTAVWVAEATPGPPPEAPPSTMPAPPTPAPARTRAPFPTPTPENQPPVLDEGSAVTELGDNPIVLVANGHDPEGDEITYTWDYAGCFQAQNESQTETEVRFLPHCTSGVVTLTWTDPSGGSATTSWSITK